MGYGAWGDIVGYGPKPGECIELIRRMDAVCIAGHHDLAAIGRLDTACFNPVAEIAVRWTAAHLSAAAVQYLDALPLALVKGDFYLVHGSPAAPVMEYIFTSEIAAKNFPLFHSRYCVVGHTHVPLAFREEDGAPLPSRWMMVRLLIWQTSLHHQSGRCWSAP